MSDSLIYLVDGDRIFAAGITEILTSVGFVVERFRACDDLLLQLDLGFRPTLLVLNIDEDDTAGDRTCRTVKSLAHLRDIPVVLYSKMPALKLARRAEAANADGFFHRPFSPLRILTWLQANLALVEDPASIPQGPAISLPPRACDSAPPPRPPGREAAADHAPPAAAAPAGPGPDDPVPVLLVDDDPLALMVLGDALEPCGFALHTAENWGEFRPLVLSQPFGALVLDVNLPGLQGDKLAHFAAQFLEPPRPRVLLHSGIEEEKLAALATQVEAFGYLEKGAPDFRVRAVVEAAVREFRRERAYRREAGP